MSSPVHVANILPNTGNHLALHRSAIAESGLPISEGAPWQCDIPGAVGLWVEEGIDLQPYRDALQRAAYQDLERLPTN